MKGGNFPAGALVNSSVDVSQKRLESRLNKEIPSANDWN